METFENHIFALNVTFKKLSVGKFWIYLLPGIIISYFFLDVNRTFIGFQNNNHSITGFVNFFENFGKNIRYFFSYFVHEIYKFIILTFLSPIYCLLSEKVDAELTNQKFDFSWSRFIMDAIRAFINIWIALFFNFYFIGIWFFISLITGFHDIDFLVYFLISAYFVGFACYDYSLERYKFGVFSSWKFTRKNRLNTLLTGIVFYLIFYIPYIGVFFAPFIMTIASTIIYLRLTNKYNNHTNV